MRARPDRPIMLPSHHDGPPAPGLGFGDPCMMALLASLRAFAHLFHGLTNRSLRELVAGLIPDYSSHQATYDLRRLKRRASSAASHAPSATS
jgi:hypothetical protein